jgi:membrane-anchored glycerophosphoryl diester phosphodiesterase (GDPDase)
MRSPAQVVNSYLWLMLALALSFIIYIFTFFYLRLYSKKSDTALKRSNSTGGLKTLASRMLLYPLAYAFLILPLASMRLHQMAGGTVPRAALAAGGFIVCLAGFVGALFLKESKKAEV